MNVRSVLLFASVAALNAIIVQAVEPPVINVKDRASIITSGGFDPVSDPADLDADELDSAKRLVLSLETGDKEALKGLEATYRKLATVRNEQNRNSFIANLLARLNGGQVKFSSAVEESAYRYFTANGCKLLKYFLMYSYRFANMELADPREVEGSLQAMGTLMELGPANRRSITDVDRVVELMGLKKAQARLPNYSARQLETSARSMPLTSISKSSSSCRITSAIMRLRTSLPSVRGRPSLACRRIRVTSCS